MGGCEDNPNFPGVEGIWFRVNDKDGNDVDLSSYSNLTRTDKNGVPLSIVVDDNDSGLGWHATALLDKDGDNKVSTFKFAVLHFGMHVKDDSLYEINGSDGPLDDDDTMDYDSLGLTKNKPLIIQEKKDEDNDDDDGVRDDYPKYPGVKGFWFQVININGKSLKLSGAFSTWDKGSPNPDVAWRRIRGESTPLQLKKRILGKLSLKIGKYGVLNDEDDAVAYDDRSGDVDLDNNGLKKSRPLIFKEHDYEEDNESGSGSDSGSSSSSDDESPPPPDNPNYTG